jgi:hypothetical protein
MRFRNHSSGSDLSCSEPVPVPLPVPDALGGCSGRDSASGRDSIQPWGLGTFSVAMDSWWRGLPARAWTTSLWSDNPTAGKMPTAPWEASSAAGAAAANSPGHGSRSRHPGTVPGHGVGHGPSRPAVPRPHVTPSELASRGVPSDAWCGRRCRRSCVRRRGSCLERHAPGAATPPAAASGGGDQRTAISGSDQRQRSADSDQRRRPVRSPEAGHGSRTRRRPRT